MLIVEKAIVWKYFVFFSSVKIIFENWIYSQLYGKTSVLLFVFALEKSKFYL